MLFCSKKSKFSFGLKIIYKSLLCKWFNISDNYIVTLVVFYFVNMRLWKLRGS